MDIITKSYQTANGLVEGVQVKWAGFNILLVTGSKGFLACGCFDLEVIDRFGVPCAMPESTPDNPIGTLERFPNRKIMKVNKKAEAMGIKVGMPVTKAFALIA
jgi:uncharacterized protein YunC (DUF1805 family)